VINANVHAAFVKHFLALKYDTQAIVAVRIHRPVRAGATLTHAQDITVPLLIVHAEDDWDIPCAHSDALFEAALGGALPPVPEPLRPSISYHPNTAEWDASRAALEARREARAALVTTAEVAGLGRVEEWAHVRSVRTRYGGHDPFSQEAVQDAVRALFFA
jgi:abhydrolase domain-containing protein 12